MKKFSFVLTLTVMLGTLPAFAGELSTVKGSVIKLARFVLSSDKHEPAPVMYLVVRTEDRNVKELAVNAKDEVLVKMILATSMSDKVTLHYEQELVQVGKSSYSNADVVKSIEIDRE